MNAIISAFANGLVLSAFLAVAVWLALRLLNRSFNAATRYAIWWITLLAAIVLPIILLAAANRRAAAPARATEPTTEIVPTSSAAPSSHSASAAEQPIRTKLSWLPSLPIQLPSSPWTARFAELWALVALLLLARLGAGFTALHFQKKYARDASPDLRELLDRCLARLVIKRRLRVAVIPEGNSPMLAGVICPCVLIPERLLSELDHAEMEQIFLHEGTHAARYDDWALLVQRVIQSVFIFYPVVYWLARQINLEREAACDADVIAITGDARAYAKCLTHVAELSLGEWKSPLVAAIADEKSYLTRRIHMLFGKNRHSATRLLTIRLALAAAFICVLAALAATSPAFFVSAQSPDTSADWEKAAGGKMSFEVASIKPNASGIGDAPSLFGVSSSGLVRGMNRPVESYIAWAYELDIVQERVLNAQMPQWARKAGFDIEAHPTGSGFTMDQERLMMQSLLASRFKLAAHFETKDGPAYALILARPGKLGSQVRSYPDGFPCSDEPPLRGGGRGAGPAAPVPSVDNGRLPASCGRIQGLPPLEPGIMHSAGRNLTVKDLVEWISTWGQLDRPLVDRTGLSGTFDVTLDTPLPSQFPPGVDGATVFREAFSDQLGLKLQSITAPVRSLVIDHVEEPTPN